VEGKKLIDFQLGKSKYLHFFVHLLAGNASAMFLVFHESKDCILQNTCSLFLRIQLLKEIILKMFLERNVDCRTPPSFLSALLRSLSRKGYNLNKSHTQRNCSKMIQNLFRLNRDYKYVICNRLLD